jgi:hypothetical protein
VPDRVHVVREGLFKESPEVVVRRPCLMLLAVCGSGDVTYARAACVPIASVVVVMAP